MESGNLENERVHCTCNVLNYNHTQFSSSSAGYHEGPVTGDWNGRACHLDYTDEMDDYGRLPG